MNERIKQLAEQAGYKPLPGFDFANSLEEVFIKKFAELIVRECIAVCLESQTDYLKERIASDDFDTKNILAEGEVAIATVRYKMKKHFGVQ